MEKVQGRSRGRSEQFGSFDRQHIHRVAHVLADSKNADLHWCYHLCKNVFSKIPPADVFTSLMYSASQAEQSVLLVWCCPRIYDVTSNELEPFAERLVATSPAKSESPSNVTSPGQN